MIYTGKIAPTGWLAFELNILGRLKFASAAMPFTGDPTLGVYLKRREVKVLANDLLQSAWIKAVSVIQNNHERLTDDDVNQILEDVYVPGHKLNNPALRTWFSETDAWWFDNVRKNLERIQSPVAFAIGAGLAMAVGDYVLSFTEETRELRQPLANVYRRLWMAIPEPIDNSRENVCTNKPANIFIAETPADLMFLRLPVSGIGGGRGYSERSQWREEWLRGGNDFWSDLETLRQGKFGSPVETKSQYLRMLEDTLSAATHYKTWAIAHTESGFVSTQDIVETIGRVRRRVDAIYTKDFSELTGTKAVIITA